MYQMFSVEVTSERDVIIIKQNETEIILHRDQLPTLTRWLKNEYCAHENGSEITFPDED